jgi:hypothetical protein
MARRTAIIVGAFALVGGVGCSSCESTKPAPASGASAVIASPKPAANKLDTTGLVAQWSTDGGALLFRDDRAVIDARDAGRQSAPCPVAVFDLERGRITARLEATCAAACSWCTRKTLDVETTGADSVIVIADFQRLSAWRLPEGRRLFAQPISANFTGMTMSPDGARLLLADESGSGRVIAMDGGAELGRFEVVDDEGTGRAFYGAWAPTGKRFVVSGDESYSRSLPPMSIRDGTTGAVERSVMLPGAGSPRWLDERRILVTNGNGLVAVVDVTTGEATELRADAGGPLGRHQSWGALNHRGNQLVLVTSDAGLEIWDVDDGRRRELVAPAEVQWVGAPSISPDDAWVALTRGGDVLVVDTSGASPPRRISLEDDEPPQAVSVEWSASGRLVLQRPGAVETYDATATLLRRLLADDDALLLPRADGRLGLLWSASEVALLRLDDGARVSLRVAVEDGKVAVTFEGDPKALGISR